jgi:nitrogen fixation/metabolism regulation signal transduction histidine kinase
MAPRFDHERRVLALALAAGAPAVALSVGLLLLGDHPPRVVWTLGGLVVLVWLGFAFAARRRVVYPLQTLANLLEALREGDFSLRGRRARDQDALGEVLREVNLLSRTLHEQRLGALEATVLLRRVMAEIDVAIFAFDGAGRLRLVNRAGERLLAAPGERLLGKSAAELGMGDCLAGEAVRTLQGAFPGGEGQWGLRRSTFREGGAPLRLVVLTDLSRTLREEERQAWQRLIRVLGHELNNSLAPIKSMAGTLRSLAGREPRTADWEDDLRRGLAVIEDRSDALGRFIGAYSRLARLPKPKLEPVAVGEWVRRAAALEPRVPVAVTGGPEVTLRADRDQLDQLLINLLHNAAEAALETGGGVRVGWRDGRQQLELWVEDEGPGLTNTANLFVPFFTTKPGGTGIGLVLCRQIAEAHGGTLGLENRPGARGCVARLRLPLPGVWVA